MADAAPALTVRNLTVTAARGRWILDVPSFALAPGTALGVRGPSGAGKSTLLFALAGLAERAEGVVDWGGTNVLALSEGARAAFRARETGMIFQDFLLFDELGPADNAGLQAMFAPRPRRAGLRAAAAGLLTGLGVPTDARTVTTFSGGERQRVAVARALAHDPGIVLADEPTASLHREAADALIDDLVGRVRARGRTLVAVSHDDRLLDRMDRVLEIRDGCPVAAPQPA